MAKSKLRVEVQDQASPPARQYDVFLDLGGETKVEFLTIDEKTGDGKRRVRPGSASAETSHHREANRPGGDPQDGPA
jgi:hypothetical protein